MRCLTCGGEMGTAGCSQAWRHPVSGGAVAPPVTLTIPLTGPGSHAWDLAELKAQRERAERAEARAEEMARAAFWVGAWDGAVRFQRSFRRRRNVYTRTMWAIGRLNCLRAQHQGERHG